MIRLIIGIIVGAAAIIFIAQNPEMAEIKFLAWSISMSQALMMLLTFIAGIIIGVFFGTVGRGRRRRRVERDR